MLTIVTPTYNRPAFVRRLLEYYCSTGLALPLVFADSSEGDARLQNRDSIRAARASIDARHMEFPSEVPYLQKVCSALEEVRTPLLAMGADDDFFVPGTLMRAAEFLAAHGDYQLAHGTAVAFELSPSAAIRAPLNWVRPYPQHALEDDAGAARVARHLSAYAPTWYSVQRTDRVRESCQLAIPFGTDYNFIELLLSCLAVAAGKAKRLDALYMARQSHTAKDYDYAARWYKEAAWFANYDYFIDALAAEISRVDGATLNSVRQSTRDAFEVYLKPYESQHQAALAPALPALHPIHRLRAALSRKVALVREWRRPGPLSLPRLLNRSSEHFETFAPIYRELTGPR